jgi:hypothetical protein
LRRWTLTRAENEEHTQTWTHKVH